MGSVFRSIAVAATLVATAAFARADGTAVVDCVTCHPGNGAVVTTLTASPAEPKPGDTVTLTVAIAGPGSVGGFYLRAGGVGRFANLSNATHLQGGEPVHNQPARAVAGVVTFQVAYTTTPQVGGAELETFTVMANDNRQNGDDTASHASLSLGWGCDGGVRYRDSDGDGIGSADDGISHVCGLGFGWVERDGDCDDRNGEVHPGSTEVCNQLDDDCDGLVDEGLDAVATWPDRDADGYGATDGGTALGCVAGRVSNSLDCDDGAAAVKPGATEQCNGRDDDCDGVVDGAQCMSSCVAANEVCNGLDDDCDGRIDEDLDCSAACVPSAEVCNGRDDDCDGLIDEDCRTECGCSSTSGGVLMFALVLVGSRLARRRSELK